MKDQVNKTEQYKKILSSWEVPGKLSTEEAWALTEERRAQMKETKVRSMRWMGWAAAAAVVTGVGAFIFFQPENIVTASAGFGEVKMVTLPDGSTATLNAGSEIAFEESWGNERVVKLKGEAFFEVEKGKTFVVKSPSGTVTVLGTSFDVIDREGMYQVECRTGKVKVNSASDEEIITPGQRVELKEGQFNLTQIDISRNDFRSGEVYFEEEKLSSILAEVERQFNVAIEAPANVDGLMSVLVDCKSLINSLEAICLPNDWKYQINGNRVVIAVNE